jgi:hypothetical protein
VNVVSSVAMFNVFDPESSLSGGGRHWSKRPSRLTKAEPTQAQTFSLTIRMRIGSDCPSLVSLSL